MAFFILLSLYGCGTVKPPTESVVNAAPFIITVSKAASDDKYLLKGVVLHSFTKFTTAYRELKDVSIVNFTENMAKSELVTEICKGQRGGSSRRIFKSCVYYTSSVSIADNKSFYTISIKPYKKRSVQGSYLFSPIKLPKADINRWYELVSNQSLAYRLKLVSEFPPESSKANFDRTLEAGRWEDGKASAATKQFKNVYSYDSIENIKVRLGVAFYPYKKGSLAQFYLKSYMAPSKGIKSTDWVSVTEKVTDKMTKVMND